MSRGESARTTPSGFYVVSTPNGSPFMPKRKPSKKTQNTKSRSRQVGPVGLRIVGGRLRGSKLAYGGDTRVRPMKDRTREAIFNLLGPAVRGGIAVDLFAGTGAMALEAISRGAISAVLIERHLPTAQIIRKNIANVRVENQCTVITADAFRWVAENPQVGSEPWLVFCCPPYDFFVQRHEDMLALIDTMWDASPPGSAIVVESDDRFDHGLLPDPEHWDSRRYAPAVVGIRWKE